ncbi:rhamnosyltransferase [Bradyrhizobium lablabi]|uniref:rhamnosyltransferase n=1 Tax=Bradyrhizobium lablabi TaxID=722472 RepID=UPI001BA8FF6E|nr:rhamnosyltransferase [Bradyrhizobium lablabi]MBR1120201.1 rhamnosyltransferase [Bradyrhizobium lablabi]
MEAHCIIVSYRPDVARLRGLCSRAALDGARVIVVDNSETRTLEADALPDGCSLISLGYNSGIAHAQNVGIAAALAAGARVLVFFDQDSKIEPGFLKALAASLTEGTAEIVAPLCVDEATNMPLPAERLGRWGWPVAIHEADADARYSADIVIASGTAATREVFERAGTLDEDFFIDFVDAEWCLRCRAQQVPIYVVPAVVMRHSIGSRHVKFGPFHVSVHSPERCYYQVRNCLLLFRKRHIPFNYALKQLAATLFSRALLLFVVNGRASYLKSYLFAVRDGLKGVRGARPA